MKTIVFSNDAPATADFRVRFIAMELIEKDIISTSTALVVDAARVLVKQGHIKAPLLVITDSDEVEIDQDGRFKWGMPPELDTHKKILDDLLGYPDEEVQG